VSFLALPLGDLTEHGAPTSGHSGGLVDGGEVGVAGQGGRDLAGEDRPGEAAWVVRARPAKSTRAEACADAVTSTVTPVVEI